jgi:hypothetical protein
VESSGIKFDLDASGVSKITGWVGSDDGFLALDINGDGMIKDGSELFGSYSMSFRAHSGQTFRNGFLALKQYDEDHSGSIDAGDRIYHSLLVWRDINRNGQSESAELLPLSQLVIESISLAYTPNDSKVIPYSIEGNEARLVSTYRKNGRDFSLADVWLRQSRPVNLVDSSLNAVQIPVQSAN